MPCLYDSLEYGVLGVHLLLFIPVMDFIVAFITVPLFHDSGDLKVKF